MPFKRYSGTGSGQGVAYPRVSIRQSGSLGLNSEAVEQLFEDSDYVVPHYDEEDHRMALEPSDDNEDYSYKLRRDESGGASVTPSAWLNKHGLIQMEDGEPVTTRYRAEVVEDVETETDDGETYTSDMLVIDLEEAEETVEYDTES